MEEARRPNLHGHLLQGRPANWPVAASEKETYSSPYIFAHSLPSPPTRRAPPQPLIPVLKATSFWNASDPTCNTSGSFLILAYQGSPPARSLTTAPAPWGPLGVVSAMGDTHTHTQRLGRCNRERKSEKRGQRPGHGSGNRLPCPVPHARRTLRELQPSPE